MDFLKLVVLIWHKLEFEIIWTHSYGYLNPAKIFFYWHNFMVSGVRQKAFIWIHEKRTKVSTSHHLFFTSCHLTFLFLWESSSEIWSHRKNRVFKSSNIEKYNFMTTSRIFSESHLLLLTSKIGMLDLAWTCLNMPELAQTC